MLQSAPVLTAPDFKSPFRLTVDASDVAAGAVLLQEDDEVCYFSKKFNKSQKNYSTIEKECLALVLALQHSKFMSLLLVCLLLFIAITIPLLLFTR